MVVTKQLSRDSNPVIEIKIDDIHPYPKQPKFFDADCSAAEDETLLHDLKVNGLRDPIVVVKCKSADGVEFYVALDGHRRLPLLKILGYKAVKAIVRKDLANASTSQIDLAFLAYNSQRRQLSKLAQIRIIREQMQLARISPRGISTWSRSDKDALKRRVVDQMRVTERHTNRFLAVLDAPTIVQRMFDRDGTIGIVAASRVGRMSKPEQDDIAAQLEALDDPSQAGDVVEQAIRAKSPKQIRTCNALARFARDLERGISELSGRIAGVNRVDVLKHIAALRKGAGVINELLAKAS